MIRKYIYFISCITIAIFYDAAAFAARNCDNKCQSNQFYVRAKLENHPTKKINLYKTAIKLNPNNDHARFNLAVALHKNKEFASALEHYNQILLQNPLDCDVLFKSSDAILKDLDTTHYSEVRRRLSTFLKTCPQEEYKSLFSGAQKTISNIDMNFRKSLQLHKYDTLSLGDATKMLGLDIDGPRGEKVFGPEKRQEAYIEFGRKSDELSNKGKKILNNIAEVINNKKPATNLPKILIVGHSDMHIDGDSDYAKKRVLATKKYLVDNRGIDSALIKTDFYKKGEGSEENKKRFGLQHNRIVEIRKADGNYWHMPAQFYSP
ncbi:MAG: hypothetical protein DHS20C13_29090 [Thermodesulfobacteriota bacterium]|nr:MAG: hypothetical protein DHS20C13_29090 [Thermodesulfobacteriota bacterium]